MKPAGYYIQMPGGLFPAPMPQTDHCFEQQNQRLELLYELLGTLIGKALQDSRLIDIPFSNSFFKMLCNAYRKSPEPVHPSRLSPFETPRCSPGCWALGELPWYAQGLEFEDFEATDPAKGRIFRELVEIAHKYRAIVDDRTLGESEKRERIEQNCVLRADDGSCMSLDDLSLDFSYLPTSRVYGYRSVSLIDGCSVQAVGEAGSQPPPPVVPIEALEDYIEVLYIY